MYLRLILEIVVAFFAVIGVYETTHRILQKLFGPRNLVIAIPIMTQGNAESAEELIREVLFGYLSLPSASVAVWTLPQFAEHPTLTAALERYGISCYVLEDGEK